VFFGCAVWRLHISCGLSRCASGLLRRWTCFLLFWPVCPSGWVCGHVWGFFCLPAPVLPCWGRDSSCGFGSGLWAYWPLWRLGFVWAVGSWWLRSSGVLVYVFSLSFVPSSVVSFFFLLFLFLLSFFAILFSLFYLFSFLISSLFLH